MRNEFNEGLENQRKGMKPMEATVFIVVALLILGLAAWAILNPIHERNLAHTKGRITNQVPDWAVEEHRVTNQRRSIKILGPWTTYSDGTNLIVSNNYTGTVRTNKP